MNRRGGGWLAASMTVAMSLACAAAGAAPLTRPDATFSGTPTFSGSPTLVRPPLHMTVLKPVITGFDLTGCAVIARQFSIYGQRFGTAAGKAVAMSGYGQHVPLQVVSWTDTQIVVTIPPVADLHDRQPYTVGIEQAGGGGWLSNTDKTVSPCRLGLPSRLSPSSDAVAHGFAPSTGASAGTASAPPAPTSGDSGAAGGAYQPPAEGSLLARELPPPPAPPTAGAETAHRDSRDVEPGEVVVLSSNLSEAQALAQQASGLGYSVKRRRILKGLGLVISVLRLPQGTPVMQALQTLRGAAPKVWMDANHRYRLEGTDAAKVYGRGLVGWGAASATCGAGRRIGLVDTAIDIHQPALRGQALTVHRILSAGVPLAPSDHGTAIAALLIGRSRPAVTAGLVPGAHLYAAVVFRRRGDHLDTTAEDVVAALDWLVRQGVQVVNLSLGGPRNLILEAAVQRVEERGIAVVAAAGNGGPNAAPVYPAAQRGVVAVTAVDARLRPYAHANHGTYISLAAPGVDVWVARSGGGAFVSGTSYAAPFVTAAIVRHGGRPGTAVRALERHARDLGKPGRDPVFGWGLVRVKGRCGR